ncbi:hypothetical protein [Fluviicola taffensis]|nr:hypothetical protein [Fluviicola taffensis]
MRLSFRIFEKNKYVLVSLALVLSQTLAFSFQSNPSAFHAISFVESAPVNIHRAEKENQIVYSFQVLTSPEQSMLDRSLENFRKLEGFISLSVNAQNEVELVTTQTIEEKNTTRLLISSTRLFGYAGYQIVD